MLANRLVQKIMSAIPDVIMNGDSEQRYPGTHTHTHTFVTSFFLVFLISIAIERRFFPGCVNLSFAYVEGESLLMALKDVALSSGRSVPVQAALNGSGLVFLHCHT